MSQAVKLDRFYPYPPERVWRVLTDRRALAVWMMDNDFEPKLGHRFRFQSQPLPGLSMTIQCEVVELEEPHRLVYRWQESPTAEPSLVVWTLAPAAGGTRLTLTHHQYSYTTAASGLGAIARPNSISKKFHSELPPITSGLAAPTASMLPDRTRLTLGTASLLEFPIFASFTWDYYLNQTLPNLLAQDELVTT